MRVVSDVEDILEGLLKLALFDRCLFDLGHNLKQPIVEVLTCARVIQSEHDRVREALFGLVRDELLRHTVVPLLEESIQGS